MSEEQSTGLLDGVEVENTDEQTTSAEPQNTITHNADEPVEVEVAQRPEWWPEKFWKKEENEADMESMAKSYSELEKKFRNGDHKAPEDYDTAIFDGLEQDDKLVSTYIEWAQKYEVTQDAFNELAGSFLEIAKSSEPPTPEEAAQQLEAEKSKLGPNADNMIKSMATWGGGFVSKGIFSPDDYQEFKIMAGTAEGISVFNKIRSAYEGKVPVQTTPTPDSHSKEELESMVADPRYQTDAAFRAKVEKAFEKAYN